MTPIIVEGEMLMVAPVINGPEGFDCYDCGLRDQRGCVRIKRGTGELFFEDRGKEGTEQGALYCISEDQDLVFIGDTPEHIAKYVAARLEST